MSTQEIIEKEEAKIKELLALIRPDSPPPQKWTLRRGIRKRREFINKLKNQLNGYTTN